MNSPMSRSVILADIKETERHKVDAACIAPRIIAMFAHLKPLNSLPIGFPRATLLRSLMAIAIGGLMACGGGGNSSNTASGSAETGIRVIHASLDLGQIDLISTTSGQVLSSTKFATETFHSKTDEGLDTFELSSHGLRDEVFSATSLEIQRKDQWSLLVYGNTDSLGIYSALIDDSRNSPRAGYVNVRTIHGLAGAQRLKVRSTAPYQDEISFGQAGSWKEVPIGTYQFSITRSVDGRPVGTQRITLNEKISYSIVVGGELDLYPTILILSDS
jgi:hypothetical protein